MRDTDTAIPSVCLSVCQSRSGNLFAIAKFLILTKHAAFWSERQNFYVVNIVF